MTTNLQKGIKPACSLQRKSDNRKSFQILLTGAALAGFSASTSPAQVINFTSAEGYSDRAVALASDFASNGDRSRPNLLLLLSDDHSVPDLGCYGHPDLKTPNLNKLAAEGVRALRMYTTAPQCAPSRASTMTGRSTVDIQITRFSAPLSKDIPIFPERLREAGYFTGLLGRSHHLDRGMQDEQWGHVVPETKAAYEKLGITTINDRVDRVIPGNAVLATRQFLEDFPEGKPFFAQISFHDPHRTTSDPDVCLPKPI